VRRALPSLGPHGLASELFEEVVECHGLGGRPTRSMSMTGPSRAAVDVSRFRQCYFSR
jgi:hypothetical protein